MGKISKLKGGTRKNAGAKLKYSEKTTSFGVRCPVSKVPELKAYIKAKLDTYKP
jgi:hypothetical protein